MIAIPTLKFNSKEYKELLFLMNRHSNCQLTLLRSNKRNLEMIFT